jgi:hypothetical protein
MKRRLNSGNSCYLSVQNILSSLLLPKNVRIRIYKNVILSVLLHGCLILREVLRRIFSPKRDEVTGGWRKLHNEELHNLYSSPSIIRLMRPRRMRWAGHVARTGEKKYAYRILVRKPEGKTPLGRHKRRLVDNSKMDLREVGWMVLAGFIWLKVGTNGELL